MTQILKSAILQRLQSLHPTAPAASIESRADALVESGAYVLTGTRLAPVGNRAALARAFAVDPAFVGALTRDHVAAASANSSPEAAPLDRAAARLAAMGINLDDALGGDSETGRDFMGCDLGNMPKGAA